MDKPIPEAVRALMAELDEYLRGCPNPETTWPVWMIRKPSRLLWRCREAIRALTAAQQQGQAACVACEGKPAPENNPCGWCGRTAPPSAPVGVEWTDERIIAVCKAAGVRWIEADEEEGGFPGGFDITHMPEMRRLFTALAQQPAASAVALTVCCGREECGGECGNEWRGMEWVRIPQQPVSVDEGMAERFCRRWYEITGRSLERAHVLASLDFALTQHQEPTT